MAVVPKQHNFTTMRILTKVMEELGLTEAEVKQHIIQEGERQRWTNEAHEGKDTPKPFRFGETSFNVIRDALKKLDSDKTLTVEHLTLYEKFVETKPEEWAVKAEVQKEIDAKG